MSEEYSAGYGSHDDPKKERPKDDEDESNRQKKGKTGGEETDDENIIPIDFQHSVEGMIKEHGHSKARMEHARKRIDTHLSEMSEKERKMQEEAKTNRIPTKYSSEDMPGGY